MAFSVSITPDKYSATFVGVFTGGQSDYSRKRYIRVYLNNVSYGDYESNETGGADSTFNFTVLGLSEDTTYSYRAVLCYVANNVITETAYEQSGTFNTLPDGYVVMIYNGSTWDRYRPMIFNGSTWEQYKPKIYDGGTWA